VVTPYGCGRGELFEGSKRRGERARLARHPVSTLVALALGPWQRVAENAANPRTGSGMQQARGPSRGESRRGGAKPRGRNGRQDGWCRRPQGSSEPPVSGPHRGPVREWTRGGDVGGGAEVTNPRRGRVPVAPFGASVPVGGTARGPANVRTLRRRVATIRRPTAGACTRRRSPGHVLEGPGPVTVEGRGGRRKDHRPARRGIRGGSDRLALPGGRSTVLVDHLTPRKLSWPSRIGLRAGAAVQEPHAR
jgi:hypothetical protein